MDKLYKVPDAPSRIEPMLRTVQMREYTEAVSDLAVKSLGKLFVTGAFQKSTWLVITILPNYIYVCNDTDQTPVVPIPVSASFKDIYNLK